MSNDRYGNSLGQRKTGIHAPNEQGPLEKISVSQDLISNPSLTLYERGEYFAEVIEYHMNSDPTNDAPYVLSCRPVDTHLGITNDISKLPLFYPIPSLYGQSIPAPGTIVKVRFDDLTNKSFGTYHGPKDGINSKVKCDELLNSSKKYGTDKTRTTSKATQAATAATASSQQSSNPKEAVNNNKNTNLGKYCIELKNDKNDKNKITGMTTSYSGCGSPSTTKEGKVILNIKGRGEVEKILIRYYDSKGNRFWTSTEMKPALDKMKQDMEKELPGTGLIITSIFRTQEIQSCFWERYKVCLQKWKDAGEPGQIIEKNGVRNNLGKPPPAGPPSPIPAGAHLSAEAIDLATGVVKTQPDVADILTLGKASGLTAAKNKAKEEARAGKKFSALWRWLLLNSENYGFFWTGATFNEPWHFVFNASVARSKGILPPPETGNS